MDLQLILSTALGFLGGVAGSWLAFRIRFERFEATTLQRLAGLEKQVEILSKRVAKFSDHEVRIKLVEQEIAKLRKHWHNLRDNTLKEAWEILKRGHNETVRKFTDRKE